MQEPTELMTTTDIVLEEGPDRKAERRSSWTPWVLLALALLGGAGAGVFLWTRLERVRLEASTTRAALEAGESERARLARNLERLEAEKAELVALKDELTGRVQTRGEELAKLRVAYRELELKMEEEVAKAARAAAPKKAPAKRAPTSKKKPRRR